MKCEFLCRWKTCLHNEMTKIASTHFWAMHSLIHLHLLFMFLQCHLQVWNSLKDCTMWRPKLCELCAIPCPNALWFHVCLCNGKGGQVFIVSLEYLIFCRAPKFLVDPLEGLGIWQCGRSWNLEHDPDFQH